MVVLDDQGLLLAFFGSENLHIIPWISRECQPWGVQGAAGRGIFVRCMSVCESCVSEVSKYSLENDCRNLQVEVGGLWLFAADFSGGLC